MSYNNKVTIKNISLVKSHVSCHFGALESYQLSERTRYQYLKQLNKLPVDTIQQLQALEPLHVVVCKTIDKKNNKKSTQYKFFSGWFWLLLCREKNIKEVKVILHQEQGIAHIKQAAWVYLLACELKCMHRKTGLGQLSQVVEQAPIDLRKSLLGDCYSWSSSQVIQTLSQESSDAVRIQTKKLSSVSIVKKSIFDELIRGN